MLDGVVDKRKTSFGSISNGIYEKHLYIHTYIHTYNIHTQMSTNITCMLIKHEHCWLRWDNCVH